MSNSPTDFSHNHVFLGTAHDENAKRVLWVVALTVVMMVGEIFAGYVTGSMALLADGFHMATHAGALGVAALAYRYAKRHAATNRYSFGTGKVGDLGGFASALVLGMVSLAIGVESVVRLLHPTTVEFGTAALIAVVGLLVNIASALLLGHGHSHDHDHDHDHDHEHGEAHQQHGHHGNDNNLKSAYVHVVADALTSVLAIVALLAGRYLGWVWLDPVIGIVGAMVIARWAWTLIGATSAVLLDQTDEHLAGEIRQLIEQPGDATVTDLHVWRIGPQAQAAIVSVLGRGAVSADGIRERLASVEEISHLTVEFRTAR